MANLEIINLSSGYNSRLFENLNLKIELPGILSIIGRNGSGKTTLLRCIAQQQAYSGKILWDQNSLNDLGVSERASAISYLHQRNNISLNLKVKELVVMGRYRLKSIFNNYDLNDYKEVDRWLDQLGILNYSNSYIQDLSGGEQQLVWICQSLIQETPILILDEPSSQLDLQNKRRIFDLVSDLSEKNKIVILVTHDIEYLKRLKGKVLNLSESSPKLDDINEENLNKHREFLESD